MSFTDFTGKEWQCDCLGCALGRADIVPPGGLVFKSQDFILHQDPACAIPGFLIASPRRHVRSIAELSVPQRHELMDIVACGIKALHAVKISEEITVIQEEHAQHLHVWMFPWLPWMDELYPRGLVSVRGIAKDKHQNATQEDIAERFGRFL